MSAYAMTKNNSGEKVYVYILDQSYAPLEFIFSTCFITV